MDSVINRLRNTVTTVTSTVQSLSVVLPGNPVTREYEINQQGQVASAGPGLFWKIYSGFKKSTKQEASIFIFEKKQLDKWNRKDRENMIEILKKGIQQLTKLKHPKILTVQYALEESRDSLAFASEPVFASLANLMENGYDSSNSTTKKYDLHEMEIKHGLIQISEGLTFLHRDAKILHGNLCPESIIISEQGSWKIFGLDFCNYATTSVNNPNEFIWTCKEYEADGQELTQQNLDYMAPEYTTNNSCSPASDMFSLGLLAYTVFNKGHGLIRSGGNWHKHRQHLLKFNTLTDGDLKCIPSEMRYFERQLLNFQPEQRPESQEVSKLDCLLDEGVRTLQFLDSIFQLDNLQKSKFYKGLSEILPKLPHRIRLQRVIPSLAQEFINPTMVPFVLPNVLKIAAEYSTNEEYVKYILPHLRIVFKLREPVQILFIFMKYMELLLQKTPPDITKSDVLPLIYGSLESDSIQVQELCLNIIPSFAGLIDFPAMKNSLLPRIRKLCLSTQSLSVRVNCLVCLGKILDHLDKWLVIDFVLPFLTEIPSREPAVIMGIIGIIKLSATHKKLGLTKEIIAGRVLPFLFPLTIENGLTVQQFNTIMTFIYELIKIVETEQKGKLEEVGAIAREQMKSDGLIPQSMSMNNLNNQQQTNSESSINTSFSTAFDDFFLNETTDTSKKTAGSINSSSPVKLEPMSLSSQKKNSSNSKTKSISAYTNSGTGAKDLTSTLINSNLNQMSFNRSSPSSNISQTGVGTGLMSSSQQQPEWSQSAQPAVALKFPIQNQAGGGGMHTSMSMGNMQPNPCGMFQQQQAAQPLMNMNIGNGGGNWTGQQMSSMTASRSMNYNLNGNLSGSPSPSPMNMMTPNSSQKKNPSAKILSKQDIDDFLTK